jgi:hypothetical protein
MGLSALLTRCIAIGKGNLFFKALVLQLNRVGLADGKRLQSTPKGYLQTLATYAYFFKDIEMFHSNITERTDKPVM